MQGILREMVNVGRLSPLLILVALVQLEMPAAEWLCSAEKPITVPAGLSQTSAWTSTTQDGTLRAFSSTSLVLASGIRIKLVEQPTTDQVHGQRVAALMATIGGVAAINGGYFTQEFTPAGLLVVDGHAISPRSDEAVLSGCIFINASCKLSLLTRDDDWTGATSARQAGPFLIDPGGTVGIKPSEHPAFARRSLIMRSNSGSIALVATSDASLYDLARCLHDHAQGFGVEGVERVLNLDGGPSTALCIAGRKEPVVFAEKASVRDILVVLPPEK